MYLLPYVHIQSLDISPLISLYIWLLFMLHLEETTETLEWLTETEALVRERKEKVTSQELKRSGLPL